MINIYNVETGVLENSIILTHYRHADGLKEKRYSCNPYKKMQIQQCAKGLWTKTTRALKLIAIEREGN
jgi:hypothetical protein